MNKDQEFITNNENSENIENINTEIITTEEINLIPDAPTLTEDDGVKPIEDLFLATPNEKAKKLKKQLRKKNKEKNNSEVETDGEPAAIPLGTTKGVETMFRNAFRTEMELLALAATKANIMISLNGFIVSALMISGAFIFASSPEFLVPAGIFMLTAAASIIFALLSASPDRAGKLRETWRWLCDFVKGKTSFKEFKPRIMRPEGHFFGQNPNILIYEDRVKIPKERYWEMMQDIMSDRNQVYEKMSDELYWLGLMANKQFKYLNMSYAAFRWGLLASLIAFISVKTLPNIVPSMQASQQASELRSQGIHTFNTVYEPSAVQQLPDGRLLVAEDESARAVSILSFDAEGNIQEDDAVDTRVMRGLKRKLSDLEALTRDKDGYVYAITSHARNREGLRRPDREHFLRFKIVGNDVRELSAFNKLTDVLENSEQLQKLIQEKSGGQKINFSAINIEGLAYNPKNDTLMLGFRDPELDNWALVTYISNYKEVFTKGATPNFADVALIDIKGGGIRSLNYDPVLESFVITNEVKDEDGTKYSQLWLWSGESNAQPKTVLLPNLRHMTNVEAVDSVVINGQPRLILMSDEGDETKKLSAKYMIVDYNEL